MFRTQVRSCKRFPRWFHEPPRLRVFSFYITRLISTVYCDGVPGTSSATRLVPDDVNVPAPEVLALYISSLVRNCQTAFHLLFC